MAQATSNQPADGEVPGQLMLYKGNGGAQGSRPAQQTSTNCHAPARDVCSLPQLLLMALDAL